MGAANVALAFANWASLDDRSFRVLIRMALVSLDTDNPPRYYAGREDLAAALGKTVPAKPADDDTSEAADAARKARASVYEVVRKAVARLVKEGVIVSSGDARFRNRAEYSLHLHPMGQSQQNVAPVTNDSAPHQTQRSVAPMAQQIVAPMAQQIVATDPTDCCPLGVEEPLKEELTPSPAEIREDVQHLCTLLADLIEHNGSLRPHVTKTWMDECRRMLDLDGREPAKAEQLIRWAQENVFWRKNILSMTKFRQKYDQLRLAAVEDWEKNKTGKARITLSPWDPTYHRQTSNRAGVPSQHAWCNPTESAERTA